MSETSLSEPNQERVGDAVRTPASVALVLLAMVAASFWYAKNLHAEAARTTALDEARMFAQTFAATRSLYTEEVSRKLRGADVTTTGDPARVPDAVATVEAFSLLLGERVRTVAEGANVIAYSPNLSAHRKESSGLRDNFAREAWQQLVIDGKASFSRFEQVNGQAVVRYAVADGIAAICVACDARSSGSPGGNRTPGDVRGVVEVQYPLALVEARSSAYATSLNRAGTVLAVMALGAVFWLIARLGRHARKVEHAHHQLALAGASLELNHLEVEQRNAELEAAHARLGDAYASLERRSEELNASRIAALNIMQDMQFAKEAAEQGARAKAAFMANISHELRTPLNGVIGMLELLEDAALTDEERDFLATATNSGETLLVMLKDILDLANADTGKLTLLTEDLSPGRIVTDVVAMMRPQARDKDVAMELVLASDLPTNLRGDATRLRQVTSNLVDNAVRFTLEGQVTVSLSAARLADTGLVRLTLTVTDTGIGIPKASLGQVFERFSQVDESMTRKVGGAGLGLSLARQIAQQMDGDIAVTSEVGVGSVFTATMVLGAADAPAAGPDMATGKPRLRLVGASSGRISDVTT